MKIRWSLALFSLILIAGCGGDAALQPEQERSAVSVVTETLQVQTVPLVIEANGSVQPWVRISPGTKIMGRVNLVTVQAGDFVRKGQQLALLEKKDLEAAVEQASAAQVMAEASNANAKVHFERMSALHERGSVTDKNLEDATAGARVSEASVMQAEAAVAAARELLQYATVLSPIDGWVSEKFIESGDIAAPGRPMFTLEDLSRVKILVSISESDLQGIVVGSPAEVSVEAAGFEAGATIDRVLPAADANTRTFRVELILDNEGTRLKSGMFARVTIQTGQRQSLSIPATAIVMRGAMQGVFAVGEEGVAHLRWIRTARRYADRVDVISGLRAGDRIVVDPPPELTDGTPVE
jgi:RND family efflux transporter MFP subunit